MQEEPSGTGPKAQGLASVFAMARTLQQKQQHEEPAKQAEDCAEDSRCEAPVDAQHFEVWKGLGA